MVYGETPYAEGFGDINSLDFSATNEDMIETMTNLSKEDIPIISLFLSGRPLIVDTELSLSSAFVSIWLPGTAIEGINDVIFSKLDNTINHDFKGKLSFSWPSITSPNPLNKNDKNYLPLFNYGFGLTYSD
jgi:beta-glucosidase